MNSRVIEEIGELAEINATVQRLMGHAKERLTEESGARHHLVYPNNEEWEALQGGTLVLVRRMARVSEMLEEAAVVLPRYMKTVSHLEFRLHEDGWMAMFADGEAIKREEKPTGEGVV